MKLKFSFSYLKEEKMVRWLPLESNPDVSLKLAFQFVAFKLNFSKLFSFVLFIHFCYVPMIIMIDLQRS